MAFYFILHGENRVMAQTPSLEEVLRAQQNYATSNMYTTIPGIIVTVRDLGQMYVDVQPAINIRSQDGDDVSERPPILNVPLQMPVSKQGGLTFPISVGTPVTLHFSMRGLEVWKRSNGYPSTPSDMRKFDIRDCVAVPGTYPLSESPNQASKRSLPHDPNDVVLVHNIGSGNEVEVRLKSNGEVEITSPNKVTVNCQDAIINSDSSTEINTGDMTITSDSFTVTSGTIALSATTSATMNATFDMNGSLILNGTPVENHDHGGVMEGGDRTNPFGS